MPVTERVGPPLLAEAVHIRFKVDHWTLTSGVAPYISLMNSVKHRGARSKIKRHVVPKRSPSSLGLKVKASHRASLSPILNVLMGNSHCWQTLHLPHPVTP